MDLYGIGFSDIRMANSSTDYTYVYDYRINTFPEEVYIHEFLHTLERTLWDYGYDIPELHSNKEYGYEQENLIGLKNWYTDYMNCEVLNKQTGKYVGLDESVYKMKPVHDSDFEISSEIEFSKEPQNLFENIHSIYETIISVFQ